MRFAFLLTLNFNTPETIATAFHDLLGWFVMPLVWMAPFLIFSGQPMAHLSLKPPRPVVAMIAASLIIGTFANIHANANPSTHIVPQNLPLYVAGWVGSATAAISPSESRILDADYTVRRSYTSPTGRREMLVTMIVHQDKIKAQEHTSKTCFEALGWLTETLDMQVVEPGVVIAHLLVRRHSQMLAVTEVIIHDPALPAHLKTGAIRFQFVEDPAVPKGERSATILAFLYAVGFYTRPST